jgi:tRNA modification GTPase
MPEIPDDTIAAISTPPGEGGIGIVRLSGPEAVDVVRGIFRSSRGRDPAHGQGRIFHGHIHFEGAEVDEVLVHVMRAPQTYTREDVVEINCHGGAAPLQAVLQAVLAAGARLAEPGEFTKRAFLNGRIDLVQAEAVIDRIRAQTVAGLKAANAAGSGALSRAIEQMANALKGALARIEAAVDFPEEDLPELVDEALREALAAAFEEMHGLLATADAGRLYREGVSVAIAGRPNVGKSSLFNALLRDARAIVTPHPGTTRDLIDEVITIEGVPVRLIDTAGLRAAEDEVERIGVDVARKALADAALILLVVDATEACAEDRELAEELRGLETPFVTVLNKIDLEPNAMRPAWSSEELELCRVSALTGEGLKELEAALGRLLLGEAPIAPDQGMVTRVHQRDSLRRAANALERLLGNFEASPEFLAIDLREALQALGEITGETTPDDVLDAIFSSFCIGK